MLNDLLAEMTYRFPSKCQFAHQTTSSFRIIGKERKNAMESTSPQGTIIPNRLGFESDKRRTKTIGMIELMEWSSRQLFSSRVFGIPTLWERHKSTAINEMNVSNIFSS